MIVTKAWFFQDSTERDRFLERAFPQQNDIPSQQTFQNLLDSLTHINDYNALALVVTGKTTLSEVQTYLTTNQYLTEPDANALYAVKSIETTVADHENRISVLEAFDLLIPTNYYNKTESDGRFAPKVTTANDITALQNDKLNVSIFNNYKDTVNPRLNVEHFSWNPKSVNDTYLYTFLPNAKVNIKTLQFTNVPSWTIFLMDGDNILTNIKIDSSTYSSNQTQVLATFNTSINQNPQISGFLVVAHTLQTVVSTTYVVPSSVTLRLEHLYTV